MTLLYIILIPVLILIGGLAVRRKWKALLWTLSGLIFLLVAGGYLLLHFVSLATKPECEIHRVWKMEEYVIVEKKCIGFAGPHYYPVYLYKNNREIDQLPFISDSTCLIKFKPDIGDTLIFDICEKKIK